MTAMTSWIMVMSQSKNAWIPSFKMIPRGKFHFFCLNRFETMAILKKGAIFVFSEVRSFWSNPLKMHIYLWSAGQDQSESIFGFPIHVTSGLTIFSTVILTRSLWRGKLTNNPKPSNEYYYSNLKFQVNRIKTVTVIVPSFFRKRWRPWRHQLCLLAETQTHTTRHKRDYL